MVHTDFPTFFLAGLLIVAALLVGRTMPHLALGTLRASALRLASVRLHDLRRNSWREGTFRPSFRPTEMLKRLETGRLREGAAALLRERTTTDKLGLLCVAGALVCGVPAGTVLLLGAAVVLLHAPGEAACPPAVALPLLVIYALFPGIPGVLCLLPVLFWPGGRRATGQLAGSFLAVGLAAHAQPALPELWLCGSTIVMGVLGVAALAVHPTPRAVGAFLPLRPMILLGLVQAASAAGLEASAQAALAALMLDLTLQTLGVLRPGWEGLLLPMPPLPGFLVLWLGVHSALGLATGAPGWTPGGLCLACLLGGLSLAEGLAVLPCLRGQRITLPFLLGAVFTPLIVFALSLPAATALLPSEHGQAGLLSSSGWQSAFWLFSGGDGAVLALPLAWLLLGFIWLVLVQPWRWRSTHMPVLVWPNLFISPKNTASSAVMQAGDLASLRRLQKRLARRAFRLALHMKNLLALVQTRRKKRYWTWPAMSVVFWLVFLGLMLALVGWSA